MNHISKLNNEAAFCIQNKDYQRSIKLLQEATKQIRVFMASSNPHDTQNSHHPTCAITSNGANMCHFLLAESKSDLACCFLDDKSSSSRSSTPIDYDTEASSRFTMFASPIMIDHVESLFEPYAFERVSYVLVYNLALAHHGMAIQCSTNNNDNNDDSASCSSSLPLPAAKTHREAQHTMQQKALALYKSSHALLVRASDGWDVSILHSLAILSNLGHLYHTMGSQDKSELCYQNLLSTICCIVDSRAGTAPGSPDKDVITESLLDGFFRNVMPLLQKGGVAAAA